MAITVPLAAIQVSDLITALQALSATSVVLVPAQEGQATEVRDATVAPGSVYPTMAYFRPNYDPQGFGQWNLTADAFSPDGEIPYNVVVIGPFRAN